MAYRMNVARHIRTVLLCSLALAMFIGPAAATTPPVETPKPAKEIKLRPPAGHRSRSVNLPWEGTLVRGLKVKESKYVRYLGEYVDAGNFYGTWELVQLVERAARRVATRYPGGPKLPLGELSTKLGGDIVGHSSHESGRDVDLGFYAKRVDGKSYRAHVFARFDGNGRGLPPHQDLRFDRKRNWELVSKLVSDPDAPVQYIFVARPIRNLLLREAVRSKAPASVIARAQSVLVQPARGNDHRSHFHVRIYCPRSDRPMCRDVAPFWAWYPGAVPRSASYAHAIGPRTSSGVGPWAAPLPETLPKTVEQHASRLE